MPLNLSHINHLPSIHRPDTLTSTPLVPELTLNMPPPNTSVLIFDGEFLTYIYPNNPHTLHPETSGHHTLPPIPTHLAPNPPISIPYISSILTLALDLDPRVPHPLRGPSWHNNILPQISLLILDTFQIEYASRKILWVGAVRRTQSMRACFGGDDGDLRGDYDYEDFELYTGDGRSLSSSLATQHSATQIIAAQRRATSASTPTSTAILFVVQADKRLTEEEARAWHQVRQTVFTMVAPLMSGNEGAFSVETMLWDEMEVGEFTWDR
jgi:hypothetical protein